ncbi:MAG: hypothetical protein IT333_01385, partial [Thermomicrobiales bacterium]|nr:hypothetical protein [Thermomicrobiales bacterium]
GRVLPIGGLRDKALAAHRAGIRTMLVPAENKRDLVKVPEVIRDEMEFHWVESMDQVVSIALLSDDVEVRPVIDSDPATAKPTIELPVEDMPVPASPTEI